jgi:serine/threonine protein kinase
LHYTAPEVFQSEKYHFKVDIWSLGILFLELLSGKRIFNLVEGLSPALKNDFPSETMLKLIKSD